MALVLGTIFQIQASATTGNTGGAGFNPANANFPTDLACSNATSATPTVSSATHSFVAGDVGNYVYVKSGSHWQSGWYQISSLSGNNAVLSAAVGAVITSIGPTGIVTLNTTAGCTSDATANLTAGTYGVDYSQQDTGVTITDAASVGSSTTLISTSSPWSPVSVGNFFHLTTAGTGGFGVVGWYEIVSYTNPNSVVVDRTTNSGTALVAGTGTTGGAGRLNGLEDSFKTMIPAGSIVWVKSGNYTFSAAATTASANSTTTNPSFFIGYTTLRGDVCTGNNRPLLALGANALTWCVFQFLINLSFTTTTSGGVGMTSSLVNNCKVLNSSATTNRIGFGPSSSGYSFFTSCEGISQNGRACINGNEGSISGCYFHDSATGVSANYNAVILNSIIANMSSTAITSNGDGSLNSVIASNTLYGREAQTGTAILFSTAGASANRVSNNIIYGFTTGVSNTTSISYGDFDQGNDFFNNTADTSFWQKDSSDISINPAFVGASQISGTAATSSGSVLTDGSVFSGVNDNVDFLHVVSGTGVTVGCYLVTSHTASTVTVNNALGTSVAGNIVYWISNGHNFTPGAALVGIGYPNFANATGGLTTSYPTIGAVVPQASAGTGGMIRSRVFTGM